MSVVPMFAHKSLSLFFSLLSLSGAAIAIETSDNKTEIVHILADRMTFNLESDTSVYNGNVSIKQGAMALSGDRIEIERKDNAIIKNDSER